jgi:hypothetical protein
MKKIISGLCLVLICAFAQAQNGLQRIIVEKYYVSNAADSVGANGFGDPLPVGSVTYRIYADMLPGYKFQAVYGVAAHNLLINTTTSFYNNTDRGHEIPSYSKANCAVHTTMLDSWFSVGAACSGSYGIPKSEDNVASGGANVVNGNGILLNNDASAGLPLTAQDGIYTTATPPEAVTFVGFTAAQIAAFDAGPSTSSFSSNNASWAALSGAFGPTADSNKVLIGQFTTKGIFHFELNLQIGTPGGGVQNFVASAPGAGEITIPSLTGTFGVPNAAPTISITSPASLSTFLVGTNIGIAANAADADGTVDSVVFFVDAVKIATVAGAGPVYNTNWIATVGSHILTARAYDNLLSSTLSAPVTVIIGNVIPPTVNITAPVNGTTYVLGNTVNISAAAADADGTVDSVEFFVDGVKIGTDGSAPSPYTFSWPATVGVHSLTARATDNDHASTLSNGVSITVFDSSSAYVLETSAHPCSNGGTFCLPLTAIIPVNDVIGYDVVLNYDKTKVIPTGVVTVSFDLINANWTSTANSIDTANGLMNISVFFNGSAPGTAEFNGSGDVFCVEFAKLSSFGSIDTAMFSIATLQESYFNGVLPKIVSPGTYMTFQETAFNSNLKFWFNNSPIAYDAANPAAHLITNIYGTDNSCGSQSATAVQPDLAGNFSYDVTNGSSVSIQKDILGTTSVQPVVNGFDAFLTRRVLINDGTFVPSVYQMIAMDVNADGVISAGDLSQINQRAVLIISEFRQAWNYNAQGVSNGQPSKDWLFIDGSTLNSNPLYLISTTFPFDDGTGYSKARVPVVPFCLQVPIFNPTGCRVIGAENYKGILLGDVNGNYATVIPNSAFKQNGSDKIVFDLNAAVVNNGYAEVPVSVHSSESVHSMDFSLQYNQANLSYESVSKNEANVEMLSNFNTSDNTLRFTSYSLDEYNLNASPVSIRFAVNGSAISASDLSSMEGFINGEKAGVEIIGGGSSSSADATISIYPNPANDLLNVVVSENAYVQIMDMNGRELIMETNVTANQKQSISTENLTNGVYMMKIYNGNFVTVKKVVISK